MKNRFTLNGWKTQDKVVTNRRVEKSNMVLVQVVTLFKWLNAMIIVIASLVQCEMQIDSFVTIVCFIFTFCLCSDSMFVMLAVWNQTLHPASFPSECHSTAVCTCGVDFGIQPYRLNFLQNQTNFTLNMQKNIILSWMWRALTFLNLLIEFDFYWSFT